MSFGKPIIAPAIGCISDVLDEEGSFLYNPSAGKDLIEAMKRALNSTMKNIKSMGEHNFELRAGFKIEKTYRVFEQPYHRFLLKK